MRRMLPALVLVLAVAMLAGCKSLTSISAEDVAGTPSTYAKVLKEPNPLLMGHWRRSAPAELNKPWTFNYCLVKKGDKYAVFYDYDSYKKNNFHGWADFTVDGDRLTSGVDGVQFYVQDGRVLMQYPGRDTPYHMDKVD